MIKLQGEFKPQKTTTISIIEGPDEGWKGEAEILENQKGLKISKAAQDSFPSGQDYYAEASFRFLDS